MERNKDDIEEFFRASLKTFNEEPSNAVWQNIDTMLDADITIWSTIVNYFTRYIWVFLIGFSLIAFQFYTQYKYNTLSQEFGMIEERYNKLESESLTLNDQNLNIQNEKKKIENSYQSLRQENEVQQEKILSFEQRIKQLNGVINTNQTKSSNDLSFLNNDNFDLTSFINDPNYDTFINHLKSEVQFSKDIQDPNSSNSNVFTNAPQRKSKKTINVVFPNDDKDTQSEISNTEIIKNRKIIFRRIKGGSDWSNKIRNHNQSFMNRVGNSLQIIPIVSSSSNNAPFNYGFGLKLSTINVITNSTDKINFGFSIGLAHELRLNNNWALTNNISINESKYEITNTNGQLTVFDLVNVPGGSNFTDAVQEVEVSNQFVDFNIGINKRIPIGSSSILFINPSIAWQFYFPQEFQYTFVNGSKAIYDEKRFLGYFGTAKVRMGFEKLLTQNCYLQYGIYAEKSLVEQGKESRHRVHVGLSGTILFGN